jgi:ketosteroid isomerase-like protein
VRAYFAVGSELLEFNPFERPLRYFGSGNQVVQWGFETFRVKETGVTHQAEWAWVFDFRDGQIIRIVVIQDLSGISGEIEKAGSKAQALADELAADSNAA